MKKIVILCVGTPKVSGDSIGPKLGDYLIEKKINAQVYGNSSQPVTAVNIDIYYDILLHNHSEDLIIVVDSALGNPEDIWKIKLNTNGIRPGGAFNKYQDRIGDIGILAVVGNRENDRYKELENADAYKVELMAKSIGGILKEIVG